MQGPQKLAYRVGSRHMVGKVYNPPSRSRKPLATYFHKEFVVAELPDRFSPRPIKQNPAILNELPD
jgi:hypothetical protein